jgi:hypothetical protein
VYLWNLQGFQKKTAIFPCTALVGLIIERNCVYCAVRTGSVNTNDINISILKVKSHNWFPTPLYFGCVFCLKYCFGNGTNFGRKQRLLCPIHPWWKQHSTVVSNEGHFNASDCYHFLVTAPIVNINSVHNCCILWIIGPRKCFIPLPPTFISMQFRVEYVWSKSYRL